MTYLGMSLGPLFLINRNLESHFGEISMLFSWLEEDVLI